MRRSCLEQVKAKSEYVLSESNYCDLYNISSPTHSSTKSYKFTFILHQDKCENSFIIYQIRGKNNNNERSYNRITDYDLVGEFVVRVLKFNDIIL
jgi:hypothetical protein